MYLKHLLGLLATCMQCLHIMIEEKKLNLIYACANDKSTLHAQYLCLCNGVGPLIGCLPGFVVGTVAVVPNPVGLDAVMYLLKPRYVSTPLGAVTAWTQFMVDPTENLIDVTFNVLKSPTVITQQHLFV